jgi:hypothetical protein
MTGPHAGDVRRQWGWAGTVEEFLNTPSSVWLHEVVDHHVGLFRKRPSGSQESAWRDEWALLRASLRDVCIPRPEAQQWSIVFEYELPLEGGRRPDVVVIHGGSLTVLEFKGAATATQAAVDQVAAYGRDLAEYHAASHGREVNAFVVPTRADHRATELGSAVVRPDELAATLLGSERPGAIDLDAWLDSDYAPLPMLIAAARRIFMNEPLPAVRRAESSGIPQAVELLGTLIEGAIAERNRMLAFIAGVPGSGKTLAGLTLVYERSLRLSSATFLSGNGPLVEVLRDALGSKAFVKDLHAYIKTFGLGKRVPREQVIVFDEAQRAWDAGYMNFKQGIDRSEPDLLIDIGERLDGWAALIGLVGDGQEIHSGEEAGMAQWQDAVDVKRGRQQWTVHCPPRLAPSFADVECRAHPELDLTISLRSRRADRLHDWVRELLEGRLAAAARMAGSVHDLGFPLYLTRSLDEARSYAWTRYLDDPEKRYGLVASARSQTFLPRYGVDSSFPATKKVKLARWYNEPRGHPQSCCELVDVVTEFGCQGLELDLPIVCWADDYRWTGTEWEVKRTRSKYPLNDPAQLRRNAYRVLLTRGRDGTVFFLPPDPVLDLTEHALLAAGVRPLVDSALAAGSAELRLNA